MGVVLVAAGVLLIWLARRSVAGRLARNPYAGVRTRLTMSSDLAWAAAQKAAAPRTEIAGWGSVAAGAAVIASDLLGLPEATAATTLTVLTLGAAVWLLSWVIAGAVAGQRAARRAATDPPA